MFCHKRCFHINGRLALEKEIPKIVFTNTLTQNRSLTSYLDVPKLTHKIELEKFLNNRIFIRKSSKNLMKISFELVGLSNFLNFGRFCKFFLKKSLSTITNRNS